MASHATTNATATGSRLTQMQMRFQQRQLQEREQKRNELNDSGLMDATKLANTKTLANGKVRQMFDERRRGAGIDRSNPLKPISTTSNFNKTKVPTGSRGPAVLAQAPQTVTRRSTSLLQPVGQQTSFVHRRSLHNNNNNNHNNLPFQQRYPGVDEMDNLEDETLPHGFSTLSLNDEGDRNNNHNNNAKMSNSKSQAALSKPSIRLRPIQPRRLNGAPATVTITSMATPTSTGMLSNSTRNPPSRYVSPGGPAPRSKSVTPTTSQRNSANRNGTPSSVKPIARQPSRARPPIQPSPPATVPPGMSPCSYCGRNFLEERLAKHEDICRKVKNTKRKVFDITKHRVAGTDAEKFLGKLTGGAGRAHGGSISVQRHQGTKKSNWRKRHEEFIAAIRAAKQVQMHLAKGGKLSDLPPPPPSENPDYIQCPHCLRRFNETAAQRHIPKCATMLHNKSKPRSKRR